jgi:uncharacterized membrane protein YidH (DUF202 family)|tara:strand:- start:157 stop:438 length:282 start_codon:yes stop_codon:yes gene_type:complete
MSKKSKKGESPAEKKFLDEERNILAEERTLLAYIRTVLAFIAIVFAIARIFFNIENITNPILLFLIAISALVLIEEFSRLNKLKRLRRKFART